MRKILIPLLALATAAVVVATPAPALAQAGRGDSAVQFRIGGFFPEGDSAFWEDTEARFTQRTSDFEAVIVGFSYVRSVNNNFEVGLNLDLYDETVRSAEAGFVDEFGFPILHDATLSMVPLTVDFRLLPFGRFKLRGQDRRVLQPAFYIGGGAGLNLYEYEEIGDFVDDSFDPPEIFGPERFVSRGAALQLHALTGVEIPVGGAFNILVEGRYSWAEEELEDDFDGFGDIDLGGPAFYVGGAFRW